MAYQIPLFELNYGAEEEAAVLETLRSKWISTGPKTAEFETTFAHMLDIRHAIALSNCTVALHLALRVLDIKPGDEVICPSLTFVATVNAVRYMGAVPVFCDIVSLGDLTIDPVHVESLVTEQTRAIIVMHYGGFPCNMEAIDRIARQHGLKVIEDACHGPLSEYQGRKLGTLGDIGCFSFFSNKNISTGEGGMIVTRNDAYAEKARLLRSHGMTSLSYERSRGHATSYDVVDLGYNYRMDDIRASLGIVQLKKLRRDVDQRSLLRKRYLEALSSSKRLTVPFSRFQDLASNYIFPIILTDSTVEKRDVVRQKLAERGIQTSVHYPAVHLFSIYRQGHVVLPRTEYVADNEITLPMHSGLTTEQVNYVVESLEEIL